MPMASPSPRLQPFAVDTRHLRRFGICLHYDSYLPLWPDWVYDLLEGAESGRHYACSQGTQHSVLQ
jgi:hypothetical protein